MSIASDNAAVLRTRFARPDSLLRFGLRLDAIATSVGGLALLIVAERFAALLGPSFTFQIAHVGFLLGYGVVVFVLSRIDAARIAMAGRAVMAANFVATVVYVLAAVNKWVPLTGEGVTLAIACGVYTAVMADLQYLGLRRLRSA